MGSRGFPQPARRRLCTLHLLVCVAVGGRLCWRGCEAAALATWAPGCKLRCRSLARRCPPRRCPPQQPGAARLAAPPLVPSPLPGIPQGPQGCHPIPVVKARGQPGCGPFDSEELRHVRSPRCTAPAARGMPAQACLTPALQALLCVLPVDERLPSCVDQTCRAGGSANRKRGCAGDWPSTEPAFRFIQGRLIGCRGAAKPQTKAVNAA